MRKETSSRDSDTHRSFSVKGSVIHSRGRQEALLLHAPSSSGQWHRPLLIHRASSSAPLADHYCSETIASYGTRCVVCDIRAGSFTGGTPFALSLNALRLPHAAKSSKITSTACHFGDRATVSKDTAHLRHRARRGASLWGSRGYEGEEDEGAASIETIASYGTRSVVCDLRACYL